MQSQIPLLGIGQPREVVNVATVPHRSPFRYPGGKTWLVPRIRQWLKSLLSSPYEFIEPFAGGGIVGLSVLFEQLTKQLTLVELDEDVAAVWQVLLNRKGKILASRIATFDMTLHSVKAVLETPPKGLLDR